MSNVLPHGRTVSDRQGEREVKPGVWGHRSYNGRVRTLESHVPVDRLSLLSLARSTVAIEPNR